MRGPRLLIYAVLLVLLGLPAVAPAGAEAAVPTAPAPTDALTFPETNQWLAGSFKTYWQANGGLGRFGFPISPPLRDGDGRTIQWLERARFEYHDQLPPGQRVLLGLLAREVTRGRDQEPPFQRVDNPNQAGTEWFQETGHSLGGLFLRRWVAGGGLPVYGFPISEVFEERNPADGQVYAVQYFERNRFEHHPEQANGEYEVQFGLLGRQLYGGGGIVTSAPEAGVVTPELDHTTTFNDYTVVGTTANELAADMNRKGPIDKATGKRFYGMTEQDLRWQFQYASGPRGCAIKSVSMTLKTTFTMPKWDPPANAPASLRARWNTFHANLQLHEDGHRDIGLAITTELIRKLKALPPAPSCPALSATINALGQQATAQWDQRNRQYDAETRHGLTQGAGFP